ncbi:MAG: hypothetical protein Kow00127_05930 [Bacteroidales bacterium]
MKEQFDHIDQLFRERFADFEAEPPKHVWENVHREINSGKGGNGAILAGFTLVLVTIGALLVYLLSNSFTYETQNVGQTESLTSSVTTFSNGATIEPSAFASASENQSVSVTSFSGSESASATLRQEKSKRISGADIKSRKAKKDEKQANKQANKNVIPSQKVGKSTLIAHPNTANPTAANSFTGSLLSGTQNLEGMTYRQVTPGSLGTPMKSGLRLNGRNSDFAPDYKAPGESWLACGKWSLGLGYNPEWIEYHADDKLTNYAQGFDIRINRVADHFLLQGGAGVNIVTESGNSRVSFQPYLGSYEDVYDVTFDTTGGTITPIYHTHTVTVYDSTTYVRIEPTKRHYTYLTIPLLAGFTDEGRRAGWFVAAGPQLSVRLGSPSQEGVSPLNKEKIISSEATLPPRIRSHFQIVVTGGFYYRLGNKLRLSVAPTLKYYINSDYEPGNLNTHHPYAVGIRSGLVWEF